jgi:Na+/proline symporter
VQLAHIDWWIIGLTLAVTVTLGLVASGRAGRGEAEYFLSGRDAPWWLLGLSMVATSFSADAPHLVTDIVRKHGVGGNWIWWAFLLTGMTTVFLYARLWRRSGVFTDLEFYELCYSGPAAAVLRGFRALYLGVLFNVVVMATVCLAAIKIGAALIGTTPMQTILLASLVSVVVAALGGLRAVLVSDAFLFVLSMVGAVAAAVFALGAPGIGGLEGLFAAPETADHLDLVPLPERGADGAWTPDSLDLFVSALVLPLAVQWWSLWYPGAEPGGGGYVAQRMLAARDERQARAAALLFTGLYYGLRPWPWILVALCSLVAFPDRASLLAAFPELDAALVDDDLAYPAMLARVLPPGWLGLVVASLLAAFVSTISTHLNWGASYVVHDFYGRFVRPGAGPRERVAVARSATVVIMALAAALALQLSHALQGFQLMLQIGAGTGLLFLLRWFWWRVNAACELVAMITSFAVALALELGPVDLAPWQALLVGVGTTTLAWTTTALLTAPTDADTLRTFYLRTNPGGPGWGPVAAEIAAAGDRPDASPVNVPRGILAMVLGCLAVYGVLFGTGLALYGKWPPALLLAVAAAGACIGLHRLHRREDETDP